MASSVLRSVLLSYCLPLLACASMGGSGGPSDSQHKPTVLVRLTGSGPGLTGAPAETSSSPVVELCFSTHPTEPPQRMPTVVLQSATLEGATAAQQAEVAAKLAPWTWKLYSSRPPAVTGIRKLCIHEALPSFRLSTANEGASAPQQPQVEQVNGDERVLVSEYVESVQDRLALLPSLISPRPPGPETNPEVIENYGGGRLIRIKQHTPDPHMPDDVKRRHRNEILVGVFRLCLGQDGLVERVEPIIPILGASLQIMQTLRTWRFSPLPVPVCHMQSLEFHIP